jgi:hypothetical protein
MGLTIFAYALGIITLVMGSYIRDKLGGFSVSRSVFFLCIGLGSFSILNALAVDFSGWNSPDLTSFCYRLGMSGLALGGIFFLRLSLSFPYDSKGKALDVLSWAAFIALAYLICFSPYFAGKLSRVDGVFTVERGEYFLPVVLGLWGLNVLSGAVLFLRSLSMKSRIFRFQSRVIMLFGFLMAALGVAMHLFLSVSVPFLYPLLGMNGFILMLGIYWAVSISRLFDLKALAGQVLATAFFILIAGFPIGIGLAYLLIYMDDYPLVASLGVPAAFLAATYAYSAFSDRFFKAFNLRGDYLPRLEKGLAEIDFSQGRGIVFDKLSETLRATMNFSDFSVLLEDPDGNFQVAHTNCGAKLTVDKKMGPFEFVINMKTDIVLKTEAIANHNFHPVKGPLLEIFESLKAEALIILREGHHIISIIALGQKKTGADYTSYDSQVLRMVYGKLFAVGFYLKNIAKESILTTVDRELQYSNQIITSVQENIDRVENPKADLSFISKSTRKLGGDFIDFVKLSPDRWFFIVGDVSGKGLNASMSMIILKSTIRVFLKEEKDFSRLVIKVNAFIKENLPRGTFFAGVFGLFDFSKDTMYFVNCGIPVMFMFSPQFNNVIEIQGEGRVLGFVRDYAPYLKLRKISLQKGAVLLITTDGIIESESMRGERYGKERVQRCLSDFKHYPAEKMAQLSFNSLQNFVSQEISDDVTILALKYQFES